MPPDPRQEFLVAVVVPCADPAAVGGSNWPYPHGGERGESGSELWGVVVLWGKEGHCCEGMGEGYGKG